MGTSCTPEAFFDTLWPAALFPNVKTFPPGEWGHNCCQLIDIIVSGCHFFMVGYNHWDYWGFYCLFISPVLLPVSSAQLLPRSFCWFLLAEQGGVICIGSLDLHLGGDDTRLS